MNNFFVKYIDNFHIYQTVETPIQTNEALSTLINSSLRLKANILVAKNDINIEEANNINSSKIFEISKNNIYLASRSTCFFKNSQEIINSFEELALFLKKKS